MRLDVVFRDMKPENIVLDASMHAKLTDFGLAKADASACGACSFVGSVYFVAPEVTPAASRYSPAVDLYALGLVAWVCLTGGRAEKACQRLPTAPHEAMRSWLDDQKAAGEAGKRLKTWDSWRSRGAQSVQNCRRA